MGIDGCRTGWVAALLDQDLTLQLRILEKISQIEHIIPSRGRFAVALDMPLGLPLTASWAGRLCDQQARTLLGPRRASIFPPPTRELLKAADFSQLKGSGLSLQAFNLFPKIREIEDFITPAKQQWLRETHPELVFCRLAGHPMGFSKKKREGLQEREECLRSRLGKGWLLPAKPAGCNRDDVLDSIALALAALDRLTGTSQELPHGQIELDRRGLRMEICF